MRETILGKGVLAVALLAVAAGCGSTDSEEPKPDETVLDHLANLGPTGLPNSVLPPIYSGCGEVQPGYDEATYDPSQDGFCSLTFSRKWYVEGGQTYLNEVIYTVEMGEPDPAADVKPWMQVGAMYCNWTWRVSAEPLDPYPEVDAQMLRYDLDAINDTCAAAYPADLDYSVFEVAIKSTRSDTTLFLPKSWMDDYADGDPRFAGYVGVPDTGGSDLSLTTGGLMTYYKSCDYQSASEGPGYCKPECRLSSASGALPLCTWDDIQALPANKALIDPDWRADHQGQFDEVFDG